jgi:hypothetical protein
VRRLRVSPAMLATAALLVAGVVGAAFLLRDGAESGGDVAIRGGDISARASVDPASHLFADTTSGRVEVLVDRDRFDPDRVQLDVDFNPYEPTGPIQRTREDIGGITRLTYTARLRCLTGNCVPADVKQAFRFRNARVLYDDPDRTGPARLVATAPWPRVEATARVRGSQIATLSPGDPAIELDWRANATALQEPTYRFSPGTLVWLLFAAAAVLVLAAAVFVRGALKPALTREERRLARMSPLERALLLVDRAGEGGESADQRLALDRLAAELSPAGEGDLEEEARELAWSPSDPEGGRASSLASRVRDHMNGSKRGRSN